jgi:hypothetical protein
MLPARGVTRAAPSLRFLNRASYTALLLIADRSSLILITFTASIDLPLGSNENEVRSDTPDIAG